MILTQLIEIERQQQRYRDKYCDALEWILNNPKARDRRARLIRDMRRRETDAILGELRKRRTPLKVVK